MYIYVYVYRVLAIVYSKILKLFWLLKVYVYSSVFERNIKYAFLLFALESNYMKDKIIIHIIKVSDSEKNIYVWLSSN